MQNRPFQIITIDDDLRFKERPLFEELVELYGEENVIWQETPEEGLVYIKENLPKRTVVILDYDFGTKKANGLTWLKPMQEASSLIYIILYTSHEIDIIERNELKDCVNNHLMALVDKTDGYEKAIEEVQKAFDSMNKRVDCILEEWILRHEFFTREKPYIKDENGSLLSMNDVLNNIRQDTDLGRKMSSNIISTAISLLQKDIDKLDTKTATKNE
jgi:DNA-binding NtrC family response regulator